LTDLRLGVFHFPLSG